VKRSTNHSISLSGCDWQMPAVGRKSSLAHPNDLASALDISPLLAAILVNRGFTQSAAAKAFLDIGPDLLHDPLLLPDMAAAVDLVCAAIDAGDPIRVHGDYDVDGVASCALLQRALSALGAKVDCFVPHRLTDGYGVSENAVRQAAADGIKLLLTADCGSGSPAALALAQSLGLQVVVTDHHLPSEDGRSHHAPIPEVNPRRADSTYPFLDLSGVGVAFKLVEAVAVRRGVPEQAHWRFLDLVALGTVADVSSLLGENRFLVKKGLDLIGRSPKKGISALLRAAGVTPPISSYHIAFMLAPRLNAAGRVSHAEESLRLLTTLDADEAEQIAQSLCQHNRARQTEEARTCKEALEIIRDQNLENDPVLLVAGPGWHPGVIGIVASRLGESYSRPVFIAALPDNKHISDHAIGSARSSSGFSVWQALHHCQNLLLRYGGHTNAGGFSVSPENVPALRAALCEYAALHPPAAAKPVLQIDAQVHLGDLTMTSVAELARLEPFGEDNPQPLLAVGDVTITDIMNVGGTGAHLRLSLSQHGGPTLRAIWFRGGAQAENLTIGQTVDVCLNPSISLWNGSRTLELQIKDIKTPPWRS
jgi:single-stranded-DNA-specific exonuclease